MTEPEAVDLSNHGRGWVLEEPFARFVGERPGKVPGSVVLRHQVRVRSPIAGLGFDQMIIDDELKAELDAEREATLWRLVHVSPPDNDGVHVATFEQTLPPSPFRGLKAGGPMVVESGSISKRERWTSMNDEEKSETPARESAPKTMPAKIEVSVGGQTYPGEINLPAIQNGDSFRVAVTPEQAEGTRFVGETFFRKEAPAKP